VVISGSELAIEHLEKWERRDALNALAQALSAVNQISDLVA